MEEWVGGLWDRFITRAAQREFPEAAVSLAGMEKTLGMVFRGLGGDPGIRVENATSVKHGARRRLLERIAGTGLQTQHTGLDGERLRLPDHIALFDDAKLNRDLYVWLAALAAHDLPNDDDWIVRNQRATVITLAHYPGLTSRYQRLVEAILARRLPPEQLSPDEAAQEQAVRGALLEPGSIIQLPSLRRRHAKPLQPVPLWLYPLPESLTASRNAAHQEAEQNDAADVRGKRRQTERTDMPEDKHGIVFLFRAESLLSWSEYVKVKRSQDEDPEPDVAKAADGMDKLSVAQDDQRVASRVRFDLDLPVAEEDDLPLGDGIPLPEWDYRTQILRPDHCRLQMMEPRGATPTPLPEHLRPHARRLRSQFAALAPTRRWLKAQPEGSEMDIDAWVRTEAERKAGRDGSEGLYLSQVRQERDLACLMLADLSLSTDAWASDEQKVIDVIRDSLMLFAEALSQTGDRYALCGFSSLKRGHVRFHELKGFEQRYDDVARGRVQAIRPGYYTRLGAAIRRSTQMLARQPNRQRLLLILSDGKPHDIDLYEGRYGIEDTRKSIAEAREQGIKPFCVTIDREGADYLPHMFGANGFTLLRRPEELPLRLPMLYAQLTRD